MKPSKKTSVTKPVRVIIVDDHPAICFGLTELLNQEKSIVVCGFADTKEETMALIKKAKPEVLILDITLHRMSGFDLLKDIKGKYPQVRILVYSVHDELIYSRRALRIGAAGYLMKSAPLTELVSAVRQIATGAAYLSEQMSRVFEKQMFEGQSSFQVPVAENLNDGELEVFRMLGDGNTLAMIAEKTGMPISRVYSHKSRIGKKLRCKSAAEIEELAFVWSLGDSRVNK
jgi:DNA-binding NarL/FixJ family response regulator